MTMWYHYNHYSYYKTSLKKPIICWFLWKFLSSYATPRLKTVFSKSTSLPPLLSQMIPRPIFLVSFLILSRPLRLCLPWVNTVCPCGMRMCYMLPLLSLVFIYYHFSRSFRDISIFILCRTYLRTRQNLRGNSNGVIEILDSYNTYNEPRSESRLRSLVCGQLFMIPRLLNEFAYVIHPRNHVLRGP